MGLQIPCRVRPQATAQVLFGKTRRNWEKSSRIGPAKSARFWRTLDADHVHMCIAIPPKLPVLRDRFLKEERYRRTDGAQERNFTGASLARG